MTRFAVAVGAVLWLCSAARAQDPADLERKRDEKLEEPFLKKAEWGVDYDAALKKSRERKKLIFAYFTRSYAD